MSEVARQKDDGHTSQAELALEAISASESLG
jgi:hypothetical protein